MSGTVHFAGYAGGLDRKRALLEIEHACVRADAEFD
jgi:hypothetical protein